MATPTTKIAIAPKRVILLLVAVPLGCSGPTNNPTVVTNPPAGGRLSRPALAKEWVGRWQPDPFAGTEWIEVRHQSRGGGAGATYRIKNAEAVANLLKELKITAIQNDIALGSIPPTFLTFHQPEGHSLQAGLERGGRLSTQQGLVHLREEFFVALNRQLTAQEKRDINVLEFLPSPEPPPPPARVPSPRSLTSITVQYTVGKQLHGTKITDRKTLDELHKALTILKQEPAKGEKVTARSMVIELKDGGKFYGQILSATEFLDSNGGKVTIEPDFFKLLALHVSRLEGYPINLFGENTLPEAQVKRQKDIRSLLAEVKVLRFPSRKGADMITVDNPKKVAGLIKALAWIEVPARKINLEKGELTVELTTNAGTKVLLTYQKTGANNELAPAAPLLGDLVEMTGVGFLWIDNQWKYRLQQYVSEHEQEAKERRMLETASLVGRDLRAFLTQVLNVVAHYRQGNNELTHCLSAAESQPIIDALAAGKAEPLNWTSNRWKKELDALMQRGAGSLDLTPGLGFYLMVVVSNEKEMLIPMYGRVTFANSPMPVLQKAIAGREYQPEAIHLVPR